MDKFSVSAKLPEFLESSDTNVIGSHSADLHRGDVWKQISESIEAIEDTNALTQDSDSFLSFHSVLEKATGENKLLLSAAYLRSLLASQSVDSQVSSVKSVEEEPLQLPEELTLTQIEPIEFGIASPNKPELGLYVIDSVSAGVYATASESDLLGESSSPEVSGSKAIEIIKADLKQLIVEPYSGEVIGATGLGDNRKNNVSGELTNELEKGSPRSKFGVLNITLDKINEYEFRGHVNKNNSKDIFIGTTPTSVVKQVNCSGAHSSHIELIHAAVDADINPAHTQHKSTQDIAIPQWKSDYLGSKPIVQGKKLVNMLADKLNLQLGQEIKQAQIRLDPPRLGHVEMLISMEKEGTSVQLYASNPQIREAMQQGIDQLRHILGQNLSGQIEVEVHSEQRQDKNQDRELEENIASSFFSTDEDELGETENNYNLIDRLV